MKQPFNFLQNALKESAIDAGLIDENLGFDTTEVDRQASELKAATQGKSSEAPSGGDAKSPKVTDNQDNATSVSKAGPGNDTFSHEAEQDSDGSSDGADPCTGGKGSPELPDVTVDYKKGEKEKTLELSHRIESLEGAVRTLIEALNEANPDAMQDEYDDASPEEQEEMQKSLRAASKHNAKMGAGNVGKVPTPMDKARQRAKAERVAKRS